MLNFFSLFSDTAQHSVLQTQYNPIDEDGSQNLDTTGQNRDQTAAVEPVGQPVLRTRKRTASISRQLAFQRAMIMILPNVTKPGVHLYSNSD